MDGTLIDSADYHFQSWLDALEAEGLTVTHEQFLSTFGWKNDRILRQWIGPHLDSAWIARVGDAKERDYRQLVRTRGLQPLPGADYWVRNRHEAGWTQAIASSAPRANIEVALEVLGWQPYFDALASGDDVRAGKPDPEIFVLAASRVGVAPGRCIVVEDAAAGVEAARRGGMRCIGVGRAAASGRPDLVVSSLEELTEKVFEELRRDA
jgi:HAD superfamily hydrolase (TIGR01509 family)